MVRRILLYDLMPRLVMAKPKPIRQDAKAAAPARDGALNPHPEAVRDPLFSDNPFFDPRDLFRSVTRWCAAIRSTACPSAMSPTSSGLAAHVP